MLALLLVLGGVGASLLLASGVRLRLRSLAAIGVAAFAVWSLYSLGADCPARRECTHGLGVLFGSFVLVGWLAGVGLVAIHRRGGIRASGGVLALAVLVLVVAGTTVGYGRYGWDIWRWGCPTDEELNRPQRVEEVAGAFAWHGKPLEPIALPVWLPPSEPAYRGALAFRYRAPGATANVLVCRERCAISRFRFGAARAVGEQGWRIGMDSNNNVPIWVTEADSRSGGQILEEIAAPQADVQPYIDSESRCYIR